jgi:hypothetical protein
MPQEGAGHTPGYCGQVVPGVTVIPVESLRQLVGHLTGAAPVAAVTVDAEISAAPVYVPTDFSKTKGTTGTR